MAATIDATVGGASSNSYATVATATAYFDERLNSGAWTNATSDEKARALIQATRRIDYEDFQGSKNTSGQALKWPRINATDDDGEEFASDAIPTIVLHATFEMALRLLNDGTTDTLADTGLEQFERAKVGALEVEPRRGFTAGQLPQVVRDLLRPVIRTASSSGRLLRA